MALAATIGGPENLVLHGRMAFAPAALPGNQQRTRRARAGNRAFGRKMGHRFEDHVNQLEIGFLV